ncbi:MAG: SH3-like domain-containing protein [Latilactobacillus curvatus]
MNYDAKKYDGQQGTVMQEVQTSWSTYVQIKLGSGATIWLDKAGVRAS